jgi:hypothetical protein
MNLSHYQSLDPDMDHRDGQERREACRQPLPADDQAAVLVLTPGNRPLGLDAGDIQFAGAAPRVRGLPEALRYLRPTPACAPLQAQRVGVIALVCRQHLGTLARTPWLASLEADGVQPREHLGPLIAVGRGRTVGQGPARGVREAVEEAPLACTTAGDALTAACARGQTSRRPRRPATESSRVPRPARGAALAWPRACPRCATAAATDGPHFWTPLGGHVGDRPSGSR